MDNKQLEEIIALLKKAGEKTLEIYNREYEVYEKDDRAKVTEADLASEEILQEGLKKYGYTVLSEESKDSLSRLKEDRVWIVDPLDGTNDFIKKTGEFSIMLGLAEKGEVVFGAVYKPVGDKIYWAGKGKGSYVREKDQPPCKLQVSEVSDLAQVQLVVSRTHLSDIERGFAESGIVKGMTQVGSTGVKFGLIAEGKAEGYFTFTDKTCQWDTCAPEIILTEAGGVVTDTQGEKFSYNRPEVRNLYGIIASNGKVHQQIIDKIREYLKNDDRREI